MSSIRSRFAPHKARAVMAGWIGAAACVPASIFFGIMSGAAGSAEALIVPALICLLPAAPGLTVLYGLSLVYDAIAFSHSSLPSPPPPWISVPAVVLGLPMVNGAIYAALAVVPRMVRPSPIKSNTPPNLDIEATTREQEDGRPPASRAEIR